MLKNNVIFVTETWKDPKHQTSDTIDDYECGFSNKPTGKGKGVGGYLKKNTNIERFEEELCQFIKLKN